MLVVKQAGEKDLPGISKLSKEAYGDECAPYSYYVYALLLYGDTFLVAEYDGEFAGYCAFVKAMDSVDEAWAMSLAVSKKFQKRGIASRMMLALQKMMCDRGIKKIYLMTSPEDTVYELYLKLGYKLVESKRGIMGPYGDRYVMELCL